MKRRAMKRQLTASAYEEFYTAVFQRSQGCWGCQLDPPSRWKCLHRSRQLDAHHLIPQRVLKASVPSADLQAALTDPRNGVLVGRYHHDMLEARMLRPGMADLPADVHAFAFAYDLGWYIDRTYGQVAA